MPVNLFKSPLILTAAFLINVLIFILIHQLVTNELGEVPEIKDLYFVDFIRVKEEPEQPEETERRERPDKPPPPEPEETPPKPEISKPDKPKPEQVVKPKLPTPNIDVPFGIGGVPYLGDFLKTPEPAPPEPAKPAKPEIDTNVVPTYKTKPVYPRRALRAGIEGVVTVEFTIAKDGSVKDPEIVKADPPDIFNRAVLESITRWKFAPEKENGQPIEKRARQDIRFTLRN